MFLTTDAEILAADTAPDAVGMIAFGAVVEDPILETDPETRF